MPGTSYGNFDEQLSEALNIALPEGDEIVAGESGDQGQAIALTNQHIILIRLGLAATGELHGNKTSKFALNEISAINLRKGALGAVIQVCSNEAHVSTTDRAPDNVIVFTGPGRVKKAEAFAAAVESATGKTVNRFEPIVQAPSDTQQEETEAPIAPPRGNRERLSLAEEIYNETLQSQTQCVEPTIEKELPVQNAEPVPVVEPEPIAIANDEPEESIETSIYNPNPRLPKPMRKRKNLPNRMLVTLGVLAALTLVGMAVMAPMRESNVTPTPIVNTPDTSFAQKSIRLQLTAVTDYQAQIAKAMTSANAEASALRSAVQSANKSAIQNACRQGRIDAAWQKISEIPSPPGLAGANENLLNGLFIMKNAIAVASASTIVDSKQALANFDEAASLLKKAQAEIETKRASLAKQVADAASIKIRPAK